MNLTRRLGFAALVLVTTLGGVWMMDDILSANGMSVLEGTILGLFSVTFGWITISLWSAVIGFLLLLLRRDPITLRRKDPAARRSDPIFSRTAAVMPVFNEDVGRVAAGLEATMTSLIDAGGADHVDFYLLSDSTDDAIAAREREVCAALTARLGDAIRLYYRRRDDNAGRKAGNIAEFCGRWGAHYDYMLVLDADSLMTGEAILDLIRGMQAYPAAGLIQTVPMPVRQGTFFGRFLQFAANLHSPVLATGFSFWQTDAANYWGHNAILRMDAFMACCGLPELPGKAPLGGEILSHDFVEAALLRRGGWHCYLFPDIRGSYEEVPGNLLDFAKRDRRWTQGNLQHLKVIGAPGLHPISRLHMLMGVLAFTASLLWLIMIAASTVDAVWRAVDPSNFFTSTYQLFPHWPVAKTGLITSLLGITIVVLLLPKLLALILALLRERHDYGGALALVAGATVELLFSVVIAPIMMSFHALFVTSVLLGRKVGWNTQTRDGRRVPWRDALGRTLIASLLAVAWGAVTWVYAPVFFRWLTPILFGLVLAAPIIRLSSSPALGRLARRAGVFLIPAEVRAPGVIAHVDHYDAECLSRLCGGGTRTPQLLPEERPQAVITQVLHRGRRGRRAAVAAALVSPRR